MRYRFTPQLSAEPTLTRQEWLAIEQQAHQERLIRKRMAANQRRLQPVLRKLSEQSRAAADLLLVERCIRDNEHPDLREVRQAVKKLAEGIPAHMLAAKKGL